MEAVRLQYVPNVTDKAFGIAGDTYPVKEALKAAGGVWSGKHKAWLFSKKRESKVLTQFGLNALPEPQKAAEPKPEITIKGLQKAAPNSPKHLAMQFYLNGNGIRPVDVQRFCGVFGKDRYGNAYGETERRSIIWMLNSQQKPIDVLAIELAQDVFFAPENIQDALLECVTEYAGQGGKKRMMEACAELETLEFQLPW